jgi:hypothetical protein
VGDKKSLQKRKNKIAMFRRLFYHSTPVPQPTDLDFDYVPEATASPETDTSHSQGCKRLTLRDDKVGNANSMVVSSSGNESGWTMTGQMDALGGKTELRDAKGELVAVVIRQPLGYAVLGRTPTYEGQMKHKLKVDHKVLYTWMTVTQKPLSFQYIIKREGSDLVYVTDACGSLFGSRTVRISEQKSGRPCALIRQQFENGTIQNPRWDVAFGPGICPRAMMCFVAMINKSMGRSASLVLGFPMEKLHRSKNTLIQY